MKLTYKACRCDACRTEVVRGNVKWNRFLVDLRARGWAIDVPDDLGDLHDYCPRHALIGR